MFFPYFFIEHSWCFHIIPIFLTKWINYFLLGPLYATFLKVLVLADCHGAAQEAKRLGFLFLLDSRKKQDFINIFRTILNARTDKKDMGYGIG